VKVKGRGHWERKCKNCFFFAYLVQQWTDLHQTKTKMISYPFLHIFKCISLAKVLSFCDNLYSVIIWRATCQATTGLYIYLFAMHSVEHGVYSLNVQISIPHLNTVSVHYQNLCCEREVQLCI